MNTCRIEEDPPIPCFIRTWPKNAKQGGTQRCAFCYLLEDKDSCCTSKAEILSHLKPIVLSDRSSNDSSQGSDDGFVILSEGTVQAKEREKSGPFTSSKLKRPRTTNENVQEDAPSTIRKRSFNEDEEDQDMLNAFARLREGSQILYDELKETRKDKEALLLDIQKLQGKLKEEKDKSEKQRDAHAAEVEQLRNSEKKRLAERRHSSNKASCSKAETFKVALKSTQTDTVDEGKGTGPKLDAKTQQGQRNNTLPRQRETTERKDKAFQ